MEDLLNLLVIHHQCHVTTEVTIEAGRHYVALVEADPGP
jgi:hypothetical protein